MGRPQHRSQNQHRTFALVGWFIYWLNQYAVRKDLEPHRKELQTLLKNLDEPGDAR